MTKFTNEHITLYLSLRKSNHNCKVLQVHRHLCTLRIATFWWINLTTVERGQLSSATPRNKCSVLPRKRKSLISHCDKKVKHATLWRHFSMWLFFFMSVCEYLIVHHDSVSCRGVKALEQTPVLTNCAVCESYLWLLCCSHQPWCILGIEKKALFTEYSSAQIYKVLCQDTETINET